MDFVILEKYALVVEDQPLVAAALMSCIQSCNLGIEIVVADSIDLALQVLSGRAASMLIVSDVGPDKSIRIETIRRLRDAAPQSPMLVFTACEDPLVRDAALALGVTTYLSRHTSIAEILESIRALGIREVGQAQPAPILPGTRYTGALAFLLTPKQLQVLENLPSGRSNREIGAQLLMSEETVRSHMKEILARLGVRNRTEGAAVYLRMLQEAREAHL